MVKRAIYRVYRNELTFFEVENRNLPAFGIASGNGAIVPIRNSGHLQFDLELIRPEPRQSSINISAARNGGGNALRLIGCVLDGLQTDPFSCYSHAMLRKM